MFYRLVASLSQQLYLSVTNSCIIDEMFLYSINVAKYVMVFSLRVLNLRFFSCQVFRLSENREI